MYLPDNSIEDNNLSPKGCKIESASFPVKYTGPNFKNDIVQILMKKHRQFFIKFEFLTKANLIETIVQGCKLLYLHFDVDQLNEVVCEKQFFPMAEEISLHDFKETLKKEISPSNEI